METVPRSQAAEYMRQYRAARPSRRRRDLLHTKAYSQAVADLKARHPEEWRLLLERAKRDVGL